MDSRPSAVQGFVPLLDPAAWDASSPEVSPSIVIFVDGVTLGDGVDHVLVRLTFHRAEDGVLAVQPGRRHVGDEKLGTVGTGPALAMDSLPGAEWRRLESHSSSKRYPGPPVPVPWGQPPWAHEVVDYPMKLRPS